MIRLRLSTRWWRLTGEFTVMQQDTFTIAGKTYTSRLLVVNCKYKDLAGCPAAVSAAQSLQWRFILIIKGNKDGLTIGCILLDKHIVNTADGYEVLILLMETAEKVRTVEL